MGELSRGGGGGGGTYVELVVVRGLEVAGGRELADDLDGLVELGFRHGCKDDLFGKSR